MLFRFEVLMLRALVLCVGLLAVAAATQAQEFDPAARAAAIAPFLDDQAFAVARFDLARLNLRAALEHGLKAVPDVPPEIERELASEEARVTTWIDALRRAGAREIYVVASLKDVPARPPFMVVQLD